MQEKIIPQNIEAEQSVLSALLIDKNAVNAVADTLRPEDFYRPAHQIIYRAILALHEKNEPIDLVTVVDELKKMDKLEAVGHIAYITLLCNMVPTAANIKYHARIVEEKAILRQLVESGTTIAAMGYEGGAEDVQRLIDKAENNLLRLSHRKSATDFVPIHEIIGPNIDRLNTLVENREAVTGLSTGFTDLDYLTAGLHPSDFIILAARPSMGKTALALNIAENIALRNKTEGAPPRRVAFFSLEMSRDQLVQRMICTEADVDTEDLRPQLTRNESRARLPVDMGVAPNGTSDGTEYEYAATSAEAAAAAGQETAAAAPKAEDATDEDEEKRAVMSRLWEAADKLSGSSIYIDDTLGLSILEMRSKARRLKAEGGLDLIVIDYLQLMQAPTGRGYSENRQHEVSEISRGLKALARELDVPVLALSQLSRSVENRQVKKPMLSDLRESGSLEQDADLVLFLYREDYYKNAEAAPSHLTELIVAKHRNGPTGKINLFFKNDCTKFISLNEKDAC